MTPMSACALMPGTLTVPRARGEVRRRQVWTGPRRARLWTTGPVRQPAVDPAALAEPDDPDVDDPVEDDFVEEVEEEVDDDVDDEDPLSDVDEPPASDDPDPPDPASDPFDPPSAPDPSAPTLAAEPPRESVR